VLNVCERDGDATHRRIVSGIAKRQPRASPAANWVTVVELMRMPVRLTSTAAVWSMVDTRTFMPEPRGVEPIAWTSIPVVEPRTLCRSITRQPDTVRRR